MAKGAKIDFDANVDKAQGEIRKVYKELEKSKEQSKALAREVSGMGRKLERAGEKGGRSVKGLRGEVGQLGGRLQAMIGAAGVVTLFAQGIAQIEEDSRGAAQGIRELEAARRELGQIAKSQEHYQALWRQAQELALAEGIPEQAAAKIVFQAESGGILPAAAEMTRAAAGLAIDPAALMEAVVTMKEAFGEMAGTPMDIANKLLATARDTKLNVTELARVVSIPAAAALRTGATMDEVFALVAGMTGPKAKPATAAERVKAMAEEVAKAGYEREEGIGLLGGLEAWQAAAPEAYEAKRLGRAEFGEAIKLLELASEKIEQTYLNVAAATTGVTPIERGLAIVESDPEVRAAREARRQEVASGIERRGLMGGKGLDLETSRQMARTAELAYIESLPEWQKPIASFLRTIQTIGGRIGQVVVGPEKMAEIEREQAARVRGHLGQGELSDADRLLAELRANREAIEFGNAQREQQRGNPELEPEAVGNR